MESPEEVKKLISDAKNICIIPSDNYESESAPNALALFYTLKELNKNVNLIMPDFPEKFNFLVPSLDFISTPKNFVISVPRSAADVSQVYYEKNEENLKIHLTIDKGNIKKDNISFYFSQAKPDLVITLGIQDFQAQLSRSLDSFGFILDAPMINIDNRAENKKFGLVNIIQDTSLSEIVQEIIISIDQALIKKEVANCLLTGLTLYYDNFKSSGARYQVFEMVAALIKKGARRHQIVEELYSSSKEELVFLSSVFQNLIMHENDLSFALLDTDHFQDFTQTQINTAVEKIKAIGVQDDLLVLWKSHASAPMVKGFFYSKKPDLVNTVAQNQHQTVKNDWVLVTLPGDNMVLAKDTIVSLLSNGTHYYID